MIPKLPPDAAALPVATRLDEIARALERDGALVLKADPGAGKTSLVPIACMHAAFARGRECVVAEPRRVAAVAAACRAAELLGEAPGASVGWRVRDDVRASGETRLEFVTTGTLLARLLSWQRGGRARDLGFVALDEFHERSAETDLALAMLLELRELDPSVRLLVMSATMDAQSVARSIGAACLEIPGRAFPVETRWIAQPRGGGSLGGFSASAFADAVCAAAEETSGLPAEGSDILAFLPGYAEIRAAERELSSRASMPIEMLHGSMPLDAQRRVLSPRPGSPRRIVLSTSIAETSLTVPRVGIVADSGLARYQRSVTRLDMDELVTVRESRARAEQRAGRAGRLAPGVAYRLWDKADLLEDSDQIELERIDLAPIALLAAAWAGGLESPLRWLSPPHEGRWERARRTLRSLELVDGSGKPSSDGLRAIAFGEAPRIGAMLARSERLGPRPFAIACSLAALLAARPRDDDEVDLRALWESARSGDGRWRECRKRAEGSARRANVALVPFPEARDGELASTLALGFFDRACAPADARGKDAWRFPSGTLASAGAGRFSPGDWLLAPEAASTSSDFARIRLAMPIDKDALERALGDKVQARVDIEWKGVSWRATRVDAYGELRFRSGSGAMPDHEELAESLCADVARRGIEGLPWGPRSRSLLERARWFARRAAGAHLPPVDGGALAAGARDWLAPFVEAPRGSTGEALGDASLARALARYLGGRSPAFERDVPERITLPSGASRAIDYPQDGSSPRIEARIQEVFGLADSPMVAGERATLALLSPAGRPLQVSADLRSFWASAYPALRTEMKARYPRHYWPENPLDAEPTSKPLPHPARKR
jgi:ATP-dependent helicase HrpB